MLIQAIYLIDHPVRSDDQEQDTWYLLIAVLSGVDPLIHRDSPIFGGCPWCPRVKKTSISKVEHQKVVAGSKLNITVG